MQKITRVIVANDSLEGMDSALAKAAMIEHYTGAEVRAMTVIYDAVAEEPEEILPEEQRVQLVEALKAAERPGLRWRCLKAWAWRSPTKACSCGKFPDSTRTPRRRPGAKGAPLVSPCKSSPNTSSPVRSPVYAA